MKKNYNNWQQRRGGNIIGNGVQKTETKYGRKIVTIGRKKRWKSWSRRVGPEMPDKRSPLHASTRKAAGNRPRPLQNRAKSDPYP